VDLAAQHIRRAYDYGMTKRQVLEAIACVLPMSGMVTGQLGLRAMQLADAMQEKPHREDRKGREGTEKLQRQGRKGRQGK
jgi:hypothetical protein